MGLGDDLKTVGDKAEAGWGLAEAKQKATIAMQANQIAAQIKLIADLQAAQPTTPPVTTGAGGTVVAGNFTGRSVPDPKLWTPHFEDDFPVVVPEREFLNRYSKWGAYPNYFRTTNKKGVYEPDLLSVVDLGNGQTALNSRLVPASQYSDGKSRSTAAFPRFPGKNDGEHLSLKLEQRVCVRKGGNKWHAANLGWPIRDSQWLIQGENDYWEQDLDGYIGAFFHFAGAKDSSDQAHFSTKLRPNEWHVIGFELIAGKSFAWFVDGKEIFADGWNKRIDSRVPNYPQRVVLQLEDSGGPTEECAVWLDWFSAWIPAA